MDKIDNILEKSDAAALLFKGIEDQTTKKVIWDRMIRGQRIFEDITMAKCKYCGSDTVTWRRVGTRWVLFDNSGETHLCVKQNDTPKAPEAQDDEPAPKYEMNPETGDPVEESEVERLKRECSESSSSESTGDGKEKESKDGKEGSPQDSEKNGEQTNTNKPTLSPKMKKQLKDAHEQSIELYLLLASGMKVFVSGPAGSGKTTAFKLVTPALGEYFGRPDYEFYFKSVCDLTGKHEFEGFINAAGQIVDTDFRKAYTEGHLFLIDEIDAANANVLTVLNATIENGWASFPDGKAPQHPHFRIGVAANTVGLGGDGIYVGRNPLDGAFRNRFYFMVWNYDEKLELRLAGSDQIEWVRRVQTIRKAHNSLGKLAPRIVVSPRASINGAILLRNKVVKRFGELEDALIWQGCSPDDKKRVLSAISK